MLIEDSFPSPSGVVVPLVVSFVLVVFAPLQRAVVWTRQLLIPIELSPGTSQVLGDLRNLSNKPATQSTALARNASPEGMGKITKGAVRLSFMQ